MGLARAAMGYLLAPLRDRVPLGASRGFMTDIP